MRSKVTTLNKQLCEKFAIINNNEDFRELCKDNDHKHDPKKKRKMKILHRGETYDPSQITASL